MAREAMDLHCELLAEKGVDIPTPQPLAHHQAPPDLAGAVWVVIDVHSTARRASLFISRSEDETDQVYNKSSHSERD
jgi:hypothetical protein